MPSSDKKIVVLGMMARMPVAGVIWQTVHYLIGLRRLGYDVYYVETHGNTPSSFMTHERDDGSGKAAAFIAKTLSRFDLGDRWAFVALYEDRRCYGMSSTQLANLYKSATLIINLHGGTEALPEHAETDRLVFLETDPVRLQVELYTNLQEAIDFLEPHCAFFTFAENYGNSDCLLPVNEHFSFRPTRQPVVLDLWQEGARLSNEAFTTVGNWKQSHWCDIELDGETYTWSKHHEFLKFIDLPSRTTQELELALSSYEESDRLMLESKGWRVRHALDFSTDPDDYRAYVTGSRGEFSVAKDQNIRLRTGWFSDRSATYLASGRPVICQETGFSNILPTGDGLIGFSTMDEIVEGLEQVNADYAHHSKAAAALAAEHFSHDVVLSRLLEEIGEQRAARRRRPAGDESAPFPLDMALDPTSRKPLELREETAETVLSRPIPAFEASNLGDGPPASIVVVTHDNLVFTRLCLESVLAMTEYAGYELIVVDNASTDGTVEYLRGLGEKHGRVRTVLNSENVGFAPACNQGLALAAGEVLVLLNNDTMVPPRWLDGLVSHLEDPAVGLVGPVTNRIANEAEVEASYETWGEFLRSAVERAATHGGEVFDVRTLMMFCVAMRRDIYERVGPLDEQFEVGMLEDDDYSMRIRATGLRVVCAEDVLVHHFGGASFGKLVPTGEYIRLLDANRRRFEQKWGVVWEPYRHRSTPHYERLIDRIRDVVHDALPASAHVLVFTKGDDDLLLLNGQKARHFPQSQDGKYAGYYPADSVEAIAHLEMLRAQGAGFLVFPSTGFWWFDHYPEFSEHLRRHYSLVHRENACVIYDLGVRTGDSVPAGGSTSALEITSAPQGRPE